MTIAKCFNLDGVTAGDLLAAIDLQCAELYKREQDALRREWAQQAAYFQRRRHDLEHLAAALATSKPWVKIEVPQREPVEVEE